MANNFTSYNSGDPEEVSQYTVHRTLAPIASPKRRNFSKKVPVICYKISALDIGLTVSPICPLCKSVPMTGEHLSDGPALPRVLSQDHCGVLLPARATSALYWTARRLMSERILTGVV
ncbi:hypothetical protein TNCV_1542401 [Trichonephila clavipes]|nr:hypothetical protein TNCV_1542401 [Trichonephila clavipes]